MPFAWGEVQVAGRGPRALRVRLRRAGDGAMAVVAADPGENFVLAADRLVVRPLSAGALSAGALRAAGRRDGLLAVEWVPVTGTAGGGGRVAVLGGDQAAVSGWLAAAGAWR